MQKRRADFLILAVCNINFMKIGGSKPVTDILEGGNIPYIVLYTMNRYPYLEIMLIPNETTLCPNIFIPHLHGIPIIFFDSFPFPHLSYHSL